MAKKMIKKMILFFIMAVMLINLPFSALAADIPQRVIDAAQSVYYVETTQGQSQSSGTAFIIKTYSDAIYLITNYHVVELNTENVSVWIGENEKTAADVVRHSEEYDLALLKISPRETMRAVTFSDQYARGQSVYALGFPVAANALSNDSAHLGKDATITDGVISNFRTLQFVDFGPELSILQINAALNSGNSGGPLVDKNGSVIGINTLGVENAQGIFGAISVADLEEFLSGTNFVLQYAGFPVLTAVLSTAAAVIIVLIVLLILKRSKKRRSESRPNFIKGVPLERYLEQYADKLNPKSVTSLMMPLALALRDKHLLGELNLRLSPKYIRVTDKGCILIDQCEDDGFVQQRFMSPEQLNSTTAGIYSDIYSFCAILDYMMAKAPQEIQNTADSITWLRFVEKGLTTDPKERYGAMQDLIYTLSPYNGGITKELFKRQAVSAARQNKSAAFPPRASGNAMSDSIFPADADIPVPKTTEVVYPADADIPIPGTAAAVFDAPEKPANNNTTT